MRSSRASAPCESRTQNSPWLALLAGVWLAACGNRWDDYRWSASSSEFGQPEHGTLDHCASNGLMFHTSLEQDPWVVVDMLELRRVDRIVIENRLDCCQARGLPLVVELAATPGNFVVVAERETPFDTWEVIVEPASVRYLRLRAKGRTYLHLGAIAIP